MGEPLRTTTADVPDFSTYPAAPSDHLLRSGDSNPRLDDVASEIGRRMGEAAAQLDGLRERASGRIQQLRESVSDIASSLRERSSVMAQDKLEQLRAESHARYDQARRYAEARPLMVIAAAGIVGVLLGAGARAWRESRG